MEVIFFKTEAGREPVRNYIEKLSIQEQAATVDILDAIAEHGLDAPGIMFRQIKGKLWEFRIESGKSHRILYVILQGPLMVLLHAFRKQSQKIPKKELEIALKRMKEVLSDAT